MTGNPYLTAHEALEMAEGMSDGEYAQLQIAADILGLAFGDFMDKLAKEHFASLKSEPHSDK